MKQKTYKRKTLQIKKNKKHEVHISTTMYSVNEKQGAKNVEV
jgi:hypothetical protein